MRALSIGNGSRLSLSLSFSQLIFLCLLSFHDDHPESPLPFRGQSIGWLSSRYHQRVSLYGVKFLLWRSAFVASSTLLHFFLLSILQKPCPLFKIAPKPFSLKRCRMCFWVRWDAPMAPLLAGGTVTSSTKLSKKNNNINIWRFLFSRVQMHTTSI